MEKYKLVNDSVENNTDKSLISDLSRLLCQKFVSDTNIVNDTIDKIIHISKSHNTDIGTVINIFIKTDYNLDLTELQVSSKICEAGNEH